MYVVENNMIRYESLLDGSVDLVDAALCYDYLAVKADNEELVANRKDK